MDITSEHLASKKQIGKIKDLPVWELATTGGLHLIVAMRGGRIETLGTGPHRAVARHIAMKREPDLVLTELSKSDHVDVEHFQVLLPEYEALTDDFNRV